MIRRLHREEAGYAVVTAIALLVIMLGVALALMQTVDTGQQRVHEDRNRESALNLAEGVLYSQGFTLAASWPGTAGTMPTMCTQATGSTVRCPNPNYLAEANSVNGLANFTTVDFRDDVVWETRVRDNGGTLDAFATSDADLPQNFTNPYTGQSGVCGPPCTWDANGDRQMWVQAKATVRGRPRNVVALLRLEQIRINAPTSAVVSGGIVASNNGASQTFVDASGSQIVTRCDPDTQHNNCVTQTRPNQFTPPPNDRPGTKDALLTPAQIEGLKQVAITNGTYYEGCPPNQDIRGAVVFVGSCYDYTFHGASMPTNGTCNPAAPGGMGQTCINQSQRAGILVWQCGDAEFSGNRTYVGLVYMANGSNGACPTRIGGVPGTDPVNCPRNNGPNNVFTTTGGFGVWGAVAVDGNGCINFGSNGRQVTYDPNVFNNLSSFGTVGLVQNTWRELKPND